MKHRKIIVLLTLFFTVSYAFGNDSVKVDTMQNAVSTETLSLTKANGDSAYIQNDYVSAIQIYETLLQEGESVDLYFNLANSYYKSGDIAKAILNYERALLLNPGNRDVRFNLNIARSKTIDKIEIIPEIFFISWFKSLINLLGTNTWAIIAILSFLALIVCLFLFSFSKHIRLKKISFYVGIVLFLVTVASNVFSAYQKQRLEVRNRAIIMIPSVTVKSTPSESGTSLFILHEGSNVSITDNVMREWKEIKLDDGKMGWVPTSAIEII